MYYQLTLLLLLNFQRLSNCCPDHYYRATESICLHVAPPTPVTPQDAYCGQMKGKLFARPLTEDLQVGLAKILKKLSEEWMPEKTYVGLERTSRMEYGIDDDTWIFVNEFEPFYQSNFSSWFSEAGDKEDCAVVGQEYDFKAEPISCYDSYDLLCEKNDFPCETSSSFYTSFDGYCLLVVQGLKTYENARDGCAEGHLMWMKNESCIEQVAQAFYNGKYFGGVFVGLKKENGKWIYNNGEEELNVYSSYDDHEFECGAVRLQKDMSLKIYSHPCFSERLWFLCEVDFDGKYSFIRNISADYQSLTDSQTCFISDKSSLYRI